MKRRSSSYPSKQHLIQLLWALVCATSVACVLLLPPWSASLRGPCSLARFGSDASARPNCSKNGAEALDAKHSLFPVDYVGVKSTRPETRCSATDVVSRLNTHTVMSRSA
jgi:hypothetical protein